MHCDFSDLGVFSAIMMALLTNPTKSDKGFMSGVSCLHSEQKVA